jgi:monofunctional biosynthetic peptidoglycan transglycosylase
MPSEPEPSATGHESTRSEPPESPRTVESIPADAAGAGAKEPGSLPPRQRRRRILAGLGLATILLVVALGLAVWIAILSGPDVATLRHQNPTTTAFIEAHRETGAVVAWAPVPYDQIAPELKRAVLVAEDIDFFGHDGFEAAEIRLAVEGFFEGKRLRGASTITQQLARTMWLSRDRSIKRKLAEAWLTWRLERTLGKRRILEIYLNTAEFSPGVFGAEAAAQRFFAKSAAELDADEAAELAACLPAAAWRPGSQNESYRAHVRRVRQRMERANWLERLI